VSLIAATPRPAEADPIRIERHILWDVQVTERAPAMVRAQRIGDRVRLVVIEGPEQVWTSGFVEELRRSFERTPDETADALLRRSDPQMSCSSLTILDADCDGRVRIAVRQAPPAILVPADGSDTVVLDGSASPAGTQAAPGDLLILCSAGLLEEPPEVLGRVRTGKGRPTVQHLRRELAQATTAGAGVTLLAHPFRAAGSHRTS
jgi:hypothetical protein